MKESTFEQRLFSFVQEIQAFQYKISSLDHIWEVLFPSQDAKWHYLKGVRYRESYMFMALFDKSY